MQVYDACLLVSQVRGCGQKERQDRLIATIYKPSCPMRKNLFLPRMLGFGAHFRAPSRRSPERNFEMIQDDKLAYRRPARTDHHRLSMENKLM